MTIHDSVALSGAGAKGQRIEEIRLYTLTVPLKEPFVISFGAITHARNLVVELRSESGIVAQGEASPFPTLVGETQETAFALGQDLARLLVGKDGLALEARLAEIEHALPGNSTIKSAFDLALHDLLAQQANLPLYRLFGGSNQRRIFTDMTVSLGEIPGMVEQAQRFLAEGFPYLKVKLGGEPDADIERIRAIREAVGMEIPLRIDANQGWNTLAAIRVLKALEPFHIDYCEEPVPCWDQAGLARVAAQSPIPIMADESAFNHRDTFRLAAAEACHYVNIKLSKSGGLRTALRIVAVAEAAGMECQVGCMAETRHALTALTHLVASRPSIVHFDIDSSLMHAADPVEGGIEYLGAGEWRLPETPGIGARFAEDWLARGDCAILRAEDS
ncbi:MAG: dipeptide epimerase [Planctomycetota bacterium]|nr:MAG: dipeptide epimerase [Planctomycetota bacterium]